MTQEQATTQAETGPTEEPSALELAVQAAREAGGRVTHWRSEVEAARVELERLEAGVGAAVVDRPEEATRLAEQIAAGRARLTIAESALPEAQRRHTAAVAAACLAEADSLTGELEAAQQALDAHERLAEQLLEQLRRHTGADWRRVTIEMLVDEDRAAGGSGYVSMPVGADYPLRRAVEAVQRRQHALRGVAEGLDVREALPDATWADLGECLRPGGLADAGFVNPDTASRAQEEGRRRALAQAERELAEADAEVARISRVLDTSAQLREHPIDEYAWGERLAAARIRADRAKARWHTEHARGAATMVGLEGVAQDLDRG